MSDNIIGAKIVGYSADGSISIECEDGVNRVIKNAVLIGVDEQSEEDDVVTFSMRHQYSEDGVYETMLRDAVTKLEHVLTLRNTGGNKK